MYVCVCACVHIQIGSGFIKAVYGGKHKLADIVPVDLTANALIAVAWHNATRRSVLLVVVVVVAVIVVVEEENAEEEEEEEDINECCIRTALA